MRRHTLDHCPVSPYTEVARIIQEELGQPPEALFAVFECAPIASASLAQVQGPCWSLRAMPGHMPS